MVLGKAVDAVRRNELLVLTSLLAGLLMAVLQMALDWIAHGGLWRFPGTVAAVAFRSLQTPGQFGFSILHIATGLASHVLVALALGGLFAKLASAIENNLHLSTGDGVGNAIVGGAYGLGVFAVAWWGVLPHANPLMVAALQPTVFGAVHVVWGITLGSFRTAWESSRSISRSTASRSTGQPTPSPSDASASRQASTGPADSAHHADDTTDERREGMKAPAGPAASEGGFEGVDLETSSVGRGEPGLDPSLRNGNRNGDRNGKHNGSRNGEHEQRQANGAQRHESEADDSADEEPAGSADFEGAFGSLGDDSDDGDDEDVDLMTRHAKRSLAGLTGNDPELAPVQERLQATLTHVAPGRAVCAVDADEDVHDIAGTIQSSFLLSLAEVAASIALRTEFPDTEHGIVGVTSEVHKTAQSGHIVAEAVVTEAAGTSRLVEAEVRSEQGEVLIEAAFNGVGEDETLESTGK